MKRLQLTHDGLVGWFLVKSKLQHQLECPKIWVDSLSGLVNDKWQVGQLDIGWMIWDDRDKHSLGKLIPTKSCASFDKQITTNWTYSALFRLIVVWVCLFRRRELLLVLIALIVLIVLLGCAQHWVSDCCNFFLFDPFSTYEGCTWCLFYEVIAIHQMLVDFWKWFLFDKMLFVIELWDFQTCDWIFGNLFVVNICDFGWDDWFWNEWEVCKANHKRHFSFSFCWKLEVGVRFVTCLLELFSVGEVLLVDCTFVLFLVVWLRAELFITVHIWTRINSKENCLLCWSMPITNMSPQEVDCIHQPSHTWHSLKKLSQETFWVPTVAPFAEKWEVVLTKNGRLRTRSLTEALPIASHSNWVRWVGRYCWG